MIGINAVSCRKVQIISCLHIEWRGLAWHTFIQRDPEDLADHNFNETHRYEADALKKITFIGCISRNPFSNLELVTVSLLSISDHIRSILFSSGCHILDGTLNPEEES